MELQSAASQRDHRWGQKLGISKKKESEYYKLEVQRMEKEKEKTRIQEEEKRQKAIQARRAVFFGKDDKSMSSTISLPDLEAREAAPVPAILQKLGKREKMKRIFTFRPANYQAASWNKKYKKYPQEDEKKKYYIQSGWLIELISVWNNYGIGIGLTLPISLQLAFVNSIESHINYSPLFFAVEVKW